MVSCTARWSLIEALLSCFTDEDSAAWTEVTRPRWQVASRIGLGPRKVTALVLGDSGEDRDAVIHSIYIQPRIQTNAIGLWEKCVILAQSGKAAWVRRHVNWTAREDQDLHGLSRGR